MVSVDESHAPTEAEPAYRRYPPLSTAIHRKRKVAKEKEDRPTTISPLFPTTTTNDKKDKLYGTQGNDTQDMTVLFSPYP